jgi:predicted nucleotide-binding protein
LREERAVPFFVDELPAGAAWVDDIVQRIRSSHVVVADITRMNPNVMFELGIAHGLGKPLILLINEVEDVDLPSDLVGYQYLMYAPDNLSSFVERLRRTARQLQARKGAAK